MVTLLKGFPVDFLNDCNIELLTETLRLNGSIWVRIKGKSMFPIFNNGSLVCIQACEVENAFLGDVIVFKNNNEPVAHRLFKKINSKGTIFFKVKADRAFYFDPPVRPQDLLGKVIAFKNFGITVKMDNLAMRLIGLSIGCLLPPVFRLIYFLVKKGGQGEGVCEK